MAEAADRAGVDELWLWEDCFWESGVAAAAAALAWTGRLRVGIGLLPVPLRNVSLTAMELATLSRLFPGRLRAAVGHGVQDWMGQVGARVGSPMTLLQEHLVALRSLLAGEEVTVAGRYVNLDRVKLAWPPAEAPLPVLAGASGPASMRLSGQYADGTVLTANTTPDEVRRACALIEQGRAASGRGGVPEVVVYVHAAAGPGAHERLAAEHRRWGEDARRDIAAQGGPEEVAAAVRRWADGGAGTVVLQPTADDPDPEAFARFVGSQVRPLLETP
jgi:alkanesulfonate monooxygenase SsuD/methylene tetrahydromethanopterin reductase-like flavin-dependent oxidoreductase (luciferase family)